MVRVLLLFLLFSNNIFAKEENNLLEEFKIYKTKLYEKAESLSYEKDFLDNVFNKVQFSQQYVKEDKKQFTRKRTFSEYYDNSVNYRRILKTRASRDRNLSILKKIEKQYKVPKNIIIALWAIESSGGTNIGRHNVLTSLSNLAFEGRRRSLFEKEFFASLQVIKENNINIPSFKGSWAGAIGECQFLPSTYLKYAVDQDQDGKRDIWKNKSDIFGSIANYISKLGWDYQTPFGYEITDKNIEFNSEDLEKKITLEELINKYNIHKKFTDYENKQIVKVIALDNREFVVFNNFHLIKEWNNSTYFALTIGLFAEKI